jgi:two-component system nitrate/nitrite response regulator NarL
MQPEETPIRIVIADEHPGFRHDLRRSLQTEGILVAGEAADVESAMSLVHQLKPDAWVLDLNLLRSCGPQRLENGAGWLTPGRAVVMVPSIEKTHVVDAFRMGARGIVLKVSAASLVARSIREVAAGHHGIDDEILAVVVQTLRELLEPANGHVSRGDYGLTPRELEIVGEIVSGRSNREVSLEFSISERTVKHHLTNIFNKLGVTSRLGLALFAVNHQLIGSRPVPAASPAPGGEASRNACKEPEKPLVLRSNRPQHLAGDGSALVPSGRGSSLSAPALSCPGK